MQYDLHTHSTASDGTCSPSELVTLADANGVGCVALTDHDTIAGIEDARQTARLLAIQLVAGVEISVSWGSQTLHILGLNVDIDCEKLNAGLSKLRIFRDWRALEIARKLERAGIPETYAAVKKLSNGTLISRTHFAQHLINVEKAKNMQAVFKHFLVKGKPGYVEGDWASLEEAIEWINAAGGLAVIAHPARYRLSATRLRELMSTFKELGGTGLEVISGSHSDKENRSMAEYARRYDLAASMGSDFHGAHHPWRQIGKMSDLPENLFPVWKCKQWPVFAGSVSV